MDEETNTEAGLREALSACREKLAAVQGEARLLRQALEQLPDPVSVIDLEGNYLWWNRSLTEVSGYSAEELASLESTDMIAEEDRDWVRRAMGDMVGTGRSKMETTLVTKTGERIPFEFVGGLMRDEDGSPYAIASVGRDVTDRKRAREQLARQAQDLLELSTPVIQVWEGVVVVPLIGTLDSQRTQRFMEVLLDTIVDTRSEIALVDITGVPTIDTLTAQHLVETIAAVRLLGADVVLTGVRPSIAQILVHLGIDLSGIATRSSLAAGLRLALEQTDRSP